MWKKWTLLAAFPVVFSACAGSYHGSKAGHNRHYRVDRYSIPKSDVPLVVNEKVVAWVDYFTGPGRERFGRYIKRSGRYAPMIRQTLKSYGLPQDVLYLAMIESGFASKAKSHASAVGVWQFIRATGNRYGLDQDIWIEERQDAEKATHAAAKYLRDLYEEFGDWYLAFAAYNSGEGTVRRAIARYGTRDFWELSDPRKGAFRAETRDYVPKFIAAAIVAKNAGQYGFHHVQPDAPIAYETAAIDTHVDIDVIAKCAGVETETIDILNSELRLGTAPPHYKVKLPPGTTKKFQLALARIAPEDRVKTGSTTERYTVGKGDSLRKIARRFGTKPATILAANGLRTARAVKRGMTLTIPVADMKAALVASASTSRLGNRKAPPLPLSEEPVPVANRGKTFRQIATQTDETMTPVVDIGTISSGYVVSVGDSWNSISQNVGIATKVLKQLNPEVAAAGLHVGDVIQLAATVRELAKETVPDTSEEISTDVTPVETREDSPIARVPAEHEPVRPKAATTTYYKVRPGDSLDKIARRHGVTTDNLRAWNRLDKGHIRPGQRLVVTTPAQQVREGVARAGAKSAHLGRAGAKTPKMVTYKVKPGDNIWTIGKKHKISPEQMKQLSQLKNGRLQPGDVLTLRVGS